MLGRHRRSSQPARKPLLPLEAGVLTSSRPQHLTLPCPGQGGGWGDSHLEKSSLGAVLTLSQ